MRSSWVNLANAAPRDYITALTDVGGPFPLEVAVAQAQLTVPVTRCSMPSSAAPDSNLIRPSGWAGDQHHGRW